jgi:hypothetical protein
MDDQQQIYQLQEDLAVALLACNWEQVQAIEDQLSELYLTIGVDKY